MTLPALLDDALSADDNGFTLRLSLPWIRSLPISSLRTVTLAVDGDLVDPVWAGLGDRRIPVADLSTEPGWWFLQDRILLLSEMQLAAGRHRLTISFALVIPNLRMGPDGALQLPFAFERHLDTSAATDTRSVLHDVA